jgi:hypothetical protein
VIGLPSSTRGSKTCQSRRPSAPLNGRGGWRRSRPRPSKPSADPAGVADLACPPDAAGRRRRRSGRYSAGTRARRTAAQAGASPSALLRSLPDSGGASSTSYRKHRISSPQPTTPSQRPGARTSPHRSNWLTTPRYATHSASWNAARIFQQQLDKRLATADTHPDLRWRQLNAGKPPVRETGRRR